MVPFLLLVACAFETGLLEDTDSDAKGSNKPKNPKLLEICPGHYCDPPTADDTGIAGGGGTDPGDGTDPVDTDPGSGTSPDASVLDRHVYLDVDADGRLDDCPNPAHNANGTSTTNDLQACNGGTSNGRVIGSASFAVSSSQCTSGGGTVTYVANGDGVDVDGDGTLEGVYGSAQACVYDMVKSGSCEVHAGTYTSAGAMADADAFSWSMGGSSSCDKQNCWYASVLAYGYGPNLDGTGYGTAAAPGRLRGAYMNGVSDSWDANQNRVPDVEEGLVAYPAILSGDRDRDGAFDGTSCTDTSCSGDAFYALQWGCGSSSYDFCSSQHTDGAWIDTDANGTFDTSPDEGARNVDHLEISDLEMTAYNGGHASTPSGGVRAREGAVAMEGTGSSDGLVIERVYVHDTDYATNPSQENTWSLFSDSHNGNCDSWTEISDSVIEQNNEKVVDNDCGLGNECGCPLQFHDNTVVRNVTSSRSSGRSPVFAYLKSIDTIRGGSEPKVFRIYNNEFVNVASGTSSSGWFMDLQAFGDSMGSGEGELWVYGNLFRDAATRTTKLARFWSYYCGTGTADFQLYFFDNTFDMAFSSMSDGIGAVCNATGERVVEKNNAYYSGTTTMGVHASNATTEIRGNEICSTTNTECTKSSSSSRTAWFTYATGSLWQGPTEYASVVAGPLDGSASCDPDGDGVLGVDYDGDGTNDTEWGDLAGNIVDCSTASSTQDVGAVR